MSAKAIKLILDSAPELRQFTEQSRRLLHIQHLVSKMLPAGIAPQVAIGSFESGTLTISTSNGAAAAKLRQLKPRLLKQLRVVERELNSIKIVVQVFAHDNPLPRKKIFMGHTARNALLTLATRLESPALRSAVIQLANRNAPLNCKQETLEEVDSHENQCDD